MAVGAMSNAVTSKPADASASASSPSPQPTTRQRLRIGAAPNVRSQATRYGFGRGLSSRDVMGAPSVHDEQARPVGGARAVRLFAVGDLVAHAGLEHDDTAVLELGVDLAL